jgi:hypothetical protein
MGSQYRPFSTRTLIYWVKDRGTLLPTYRLPEKPVYALTLVKISMMDCSLVTMSSHHRARSPNYRKEKDEMRSR